MSIAVSLDELPTRIGEHPWGYLLSVGSDGRPRCVALAPQIDGSTWRFAAGERTRAAVGAGPARLAWISPPAAPGGYSLIVDLDARADGDVLACTPTSAVLHRPAP